MLLFYCLIALMILLALFMIGRGLLQGRRGAGSGEKSISLAIYKQRLQELGNEHRQGVITEEQFTAARNELERALLTELDTTSTADTGESNAPVRSDWLNIGIISVLIPVVALTLYLRLGQPNLIPILKGLSAQQQTTDGGHSVSAASIEAMVDSLAKRLEANPDDAEGLYLLARSYMSLKRYEAAADTYRRLLEVAGDHPNILLPYADALAMARDGTISGQPEKLVLRALELDPENTMGLWLAGLAAFEQERYTDALGYWNTLLPKLQPGSEDIEQVQTLISRATEALGEPQAGSAPVARPVPETGTVGGSTVEVNVSLAEDMASRVQPEQVVFIYAQPVDGPPMPVAVVRKQVSDLPVEVILDDSMAMMPTHQLSGFDQVQISARVSATGDATPQSGDLVAEAVLVEVTGDEPVRLTIDRQIP